MLVQGAINVNFFLPDVVVHSTARTTTAATKDESINSGSVNQVVLDPVVDTRTDDIHRASTVTSASWANSRAKRMTVSRLLPVNFSCQPGVNGTSSS